MYAGTLKGWMAVNETLREWERRRAEGGGGHPSFRGYIRITGTLVRDGGKFAGIILLEHPIERLCTRPSPAGQASPR